ncbi:hypothetical protein BgAZ_402840 [Babesia gibsoni]|uniref:Uncharacterized protein n=1 Tax=Babesia gibsoni TaxID=33632 RepID=A0AAD8LK07_BABGI|nr:hypothetical protein BgAZ_402840 [Babesia gibsoni]
MDYQKACFNGRIERDKCCRLYKSMISSCSSATPEKDYHYIQRVAAECSGLPNGGDITALQSLECENDIFAMVVRHNGSSKGVLQELLPVEAIRDVIILLHDASGLTWSGTISVFTVMLKLAFVPLWAMGERARRNNAHLVPLAIQLQEELMQAHKSGDVKAAIQIQRRLYRQMTRKKFVKGAAIQMVAAATQAITFAWVYGGLKMFAVDPRHCPSFILEKSIWIDSLALPDPYYILPGVLWLLMTLTYELNRHTTEQIRRTYGAKSDMMMEQEHKNKKMKYFTRGTIAIFAYFSCTMTSGAFFYLIPSFLFQAVVRYITQTGHMAKILRLPTPVLNAEQNGSCNLQRVKTFH